MTKNKALTELFKGKRMKAVSWDNRTYIEVKNGQVIDNAGEQFDIMSSTEKEWIEWQEVKEQNSRIMNRNEALEALYSGKRVKALEWTNKELFVENGQIMINGAKQFDITRAKEEKWIIVEPKKDTSNEISELKEMIKELLEKKAPVIDGRHPNNQNNTNDILIAIYGVSTPSKVKALFKEKLESAKNSRDIQKTVCEFIPYCWAGGRTLNTTSTYYTEMRNIIKELHNEEYRDTALSLFLPPAGLYEHTKETVDNNKKEKIRNKNTFDPKHINNLLKEIKEKLQNNSFENKPRQTTLEREKAYWAYAYLTLTTGRRQAEILKSLRLEKKEDEWYFCGVSKDRKGGKCVKAYALDDDFIFLSELLDYIQKHIDADKFTQREINGKFNNPFNNALKRITGTSLTAKDWREIYTEMMWRKNGLKDGSNIDKRDFRAEVLGHEYDGKLSATEHYEGWEAKDE